MSTPETAQAASSARPRARMYNIDLLRVLTFTCVVFVHSYGAMNPPDAPDMGAVSLLMHFTRYSFVFITAFVLFHGYYRKDTKASTFYRRRFGAIVLPYVVWTLIYTVLTFTTIETPESVWGGLWTTICNLLQGTGWFHLYFLLVSMQMYLLFPVLRWLVRRTAGHHGKLLLAAAVVQVGVMLLFSYVPAPPGVIGTQLWAMQASILPSYALFCILGALFAVHAERIREFLTAHYWLFGAAFVVGLAGSLTAFFLRVNEGVTPDLAANPVHPDVLPWALGSILGLYAFCIWWAARRKPGTLLARIVDWGSIRAFGVYAVHPFMVNLQWAPLHEQWANFFGNRILGGAVMFLSTLLLSVIAVELMLRTPFAKALVARSPLRRTG
ncbi:acyltransferase [Sciscionella sediminilitoris]|uniref:acyltransferase n=1 Tax=Sciscionella sediminilitoris TaxID=1445613 RepID=UPI0006EBCEAD|nr:acyltransferase [Sciscionella sp. SE31]